MYCALLKASDYADFNIKTSAVQEIFQLRNRLLQKLTMKLLTVAAQVIKAEEGEHVKDGSITIRRADVARFILDQCLASESWSRKKVSIAV